MAQIDLRYCTLEIRDGASHKLAIKLGSGNLTYTEKKDRQYTKDRGLLDQVRDGEDQPMEVKLDATFEFVTGATPASPTTPASTFTAEDAFKNRGGASGWTSTSDDACQPFCVDLYIIYQPPCDDDGSDEVTVLPEFRYEQVDHDFKNGTISFSGKCNVTEATATRGAAST